jgi:hypothetical protein
MLYIRFFLVAFLLFIGKTAVFGQTVQLTTNPVVNELIVRSGETVSVSGQVVSSGLYQSTYHVRVIFKRSDDLIFTLYNTQWTLYSGSNNINVSFTISGSAIWSSSTSEGVLYAEVQEVSQGSTVFKSATINVKKSSSTSTSPGSGEPAKPTDVSAQAVAFDKILLTWRDNSTNENGFRIMWSNGKGTDGPYYDVIVGTNKTQYLHENLLPNTRYVYSVGAFEGFYFPNIPISWADRWVEATTFIECPPDVSLDGTSTRVYTTKAINTIQTGGGFVLKNTSPVSFSAGEYIVFKQGSRIAAGVNFVAKIEPCTGATSRTSSESSDATSLSFTESDVAVYPNPSDGQFKVYFQTPLTSPGELILYDKYSNKLYSSILEAGMSDLPLSFQNLPSDVYYLHIIRQDKRTVTRVLISR